MFCESGKTLKLGVFKSDGFRMSMCYAGWLNLVMYVTLKDVLCDFLVGMLDFEWCCAYVIS